MAKCRVSYYYHSWVHNTVTNELRAVSSAFAPRVPRLALFPERRAVHLADMSEIVSDVRWSTALF